LETGKEQDLTRTLLAALHREGPAAGKLDLNVADDRSLRTLLETSPDVTRDDAAFIAEKITEKRKETAVFRSVDDVAGIEKMSSAALEMLRQGAYVGPFALRSQSYVGPTIGRELLTKTMWAIVGSLAGMLVYIGFRFQFRWGVAAVVALVHDTIVTLGLFSLFGKEMSLSVVAAFLTLVGYSTNDTVVVFDRIRENIKMRGAADLTTLINQSINQTISRTILTSGLTWMVVLALFLFAGEPLNPFSFVLTVGIVVGTYSSIYIASPFLVIWQAFLDRRKGSKPAAAPVAAAPGQGATPKKAKKVRTTPVG
jgi:preprotein translocase subunit SecF